MLGADQISHIEFTFAKRYDIDLIGIRNDAKVLMAAVQSPDSSNPENASACYAYDGRQAFVPDLDTLDCATVKPDGRLSDRQVEANLDDATKLLQTCLLLRSQYGELARHRNETRFKGEEFVRLDTVHKQEVEAGLYRLPWQEAADERRGLEEALAHAQKQRGIPQEMLKDSRGDCRYSALLSEAAVGDNVAKNAFITKNVANTFKDLVGRAATQTMEYRSGIELATWLETLANAESTIAQLTAKLAIASRKEVYLAKDEQFRLHRAQISRQLAWLQIAEHCRTDAELNYDERLRAAKALFDANLQALAERLSVIESGITGLYGIDMRFGRPAKGRLLDEGAVWVARVAEELAKWRRTQRLSVVSVPCQGAIDIHPSTGSIQAAFTVDEAIVPDRRASMRGANLEFVGSGSGPICVSITPPQTLTTGSPGPLLFGRVCSVAPGLDLRPQHSDLLWNGNPCGTWKAAGVADPSLGVPTKLVLYLWVASR
jgi:hypothetical protein